MVKSQTMNTWAVVKIGGKQFKVVPGKSILVDRLKTDGKGDGIKFSEVLLVASENKVDIGKPVISGAKVSAKVVEDVKDKKIRVVKFKSKSRYLRTRGHRQQKTRLLIEKIEK